MRFVLRILGTEVFAVETGDAATEEPGDCTTYPVGFVRSEPDRLPSLYGGDE